MLKKLSELSKDEKILLLQAVANKQIEPDEYDRNSLFAIQYQDAFLSMMMTAGNPDLSVCCIGRAAEAMALIDSYTAPPLKTFDRLESGLYQCKETGEELTEQQIKALEKDYLITIEVTSDLTNPATGYQLIPKSKEMFINDLEAHK